MKKHKLKNIYYLSYPDCSPADPKNAHSEVRIEVGTEDSQYDFEACYSIEVVTIDSLCQRLRQKVGGALPIRSALVISRFEDAIIIEAIEDILDEIDQFATRIE